MKTYTSYASPKTPAVDAELARRALKNKKAIEALGLDTTYLPGGAQSITLGLSNAVINTNAAGTYTLISGSPGLHLHIYQLFIWSAGAQTIEFFEDTTTLTGPLTSWPAATGLLLPNVGDPHFELAPGASFKFSISASAQFSGFVKYRAL
jgi:hypothetical protein